VRRLRVLLDFGASTSTSSPQPLGEIAQDGRELFWEWSIEFQTRPLPVSPLVFAPRPGVQRLPALPTLLRDALPDGWGRLLMDRHFSRHLPHHAVTDLDRLAWMGGRAMGALVFEPSTEPSEQPAVLMLERMAQEAWDFHDGVAEEVLPDLLKAGGTPGGVRPKAVIGLPDDPRTNGVWRGDGTLPPGVSHWIVKFNARADAADAGPLEFVYAQMAKAAGLQMADCRLIETKAGRFFATRRFDRTLGGGRLHLHCVASLLGMADYGVGQPAHLVTQVTRRLTSDQREVDKAWRWLAFNVIAHNRDDHLRNFALLMDAGGAWHLAPAYDLTFAEGPHGWHSISFGEKEADPRHADLLALARREGVDDAPEYLAQIVEAVSQFESLATQTGVTSGARKAIAARLAVIRKNA